jgi:predicted GTPase
MEEYEPHIAVGNVIYAGVDYEQILREAEQEADLILWDGGNNDPSFYHSDLTVTVADPLRPGHELLYWAGETNLSMADVVIINKCDSARPQDIEVVKDNTHARNPNAVVICADSPVELDNPAAVKGKRVLVVEDGPTLTHGGMNIGAGYVAAGRYGAAEIIDPRPYAVGSIKNAYSKYSQLGHVVPALGYYPEQLAELEQTIEAADCDAIVIGTPIDLRRVIKISKPATRASYVLREHDPEVLRQAVANVVKQS